MRSEVLQLPTIMSMVNGMFLLLPAAIQQVSSAEIVSCVNILKPGILRLWVIAMAIGTFPFHRIAPIRVCSAGIV